MPPPDIEYEFEQTPNVGSTQEIAPGIHWLRMPLPFQLAHINLWLFSDGDAWVVVDTGLGTEDTRNAWELAFTGRCADYRCRMSSSPTCIPITSVVPAGWPGASASTSG